MFIEKLQTPLTVDNAIIQLGDIDDSQKGRQFKSRFIQAGIAGYPKQFGNVLITKETLDKFVNTLVDKPVIINHKDEIKKEDEVGKVTKVWFNSEDGWFWCEGYLTDETAINLIKDKGWSVSCSYDVLLLDDEGGTENNIKYDKEFLNGKFTHLAIVENPRYERANIVVNSKTEILNKGIETMEIDNARNFDGQEGDWITVNGVHVFVKKGQSKEDAVADFIEKQQGKSNKKEKETSKLYDNLLNDKRLIDHLRESIKAQKAENPDAKVGDTYIDSDRFISLYTDKLSPKEYDTFNFDKAEELVFEKLKEMEKDAGFKDNSSEKHTKRQVTEEELFGKQKETKTEKTLKELQKEKDNAFSEAMKAKKAGDKEKAKEWTNKFWELKEKIGNFDKEKPAEQKDKKADKDFSGMPKHETVKEQKLEDGISEITDKYGRTTFKKGNKWADVMKNGTYYFAAYGLTHKTGVSWEDEKGVTHDQLLHGKGFKTEKGARKWALEQLKRITSDNSADSTIEKGIKKIFNSYVPTKEDIPLLQGLIDILEKY